MSGGKEQRTDLLERTKEFAVRIIKMCSNLPTTMPGRTLGSQVLRSGTSVGAQYREARRARSDAEFVSKLKSAMQELEETCYWLELIFDSEFLPASRLSQLQDEGEQLMKMLAASVRTA